MEVNVEKFGKEIDLHKFQIKDMQLEIDILQETLNVLRKDPIVDMTVLRNKEKAVIIGTPKMNIHCSLPLTIGPMYG